MRTVRYLAAILAALLPSVADGQSAPPSTPSAEPVRWEIIHRSRYATLHNQFRPGLTGDDQAAVLRTTVRLAIPLGWMTLGGEVQDVRAYLTDSQSNVSTALVDPIDLLQVHLRTRGGGVARPWLPEITAGRFSMELGGGRLVAQEAFRDVTRAFTGGQARWQHAGHSLLAFATLPVLTLPEDRASLLQNQPAADREHLNLRFLGLFYDHTTGAGIRSEFYGFRLDEGDAERRQTRDRALWTIGTRLLRTSRPGAADFEVELAGQIGRARASAADTDVRMLDVRAGYLHGSAGYSFRGVGTPRINVEYDYGSGDADPADGRWNRFDSLFGNRRVDLAPSGIYGALGRENIDTVGVRVSMTPTRRIDLFSVYRWLNLAAATDAFASTGVRDATGHAGRDAGRQFDMRFRAWLVAGVLRAEAGVTHLTPGPFLRTAPNATHGGSTTFIYADVTYSGRNR